ncbi:iron-sulfur cluster assembly scaffold protein [Pseudahrensia aquimaris]|uniref:Iron-sulfur cluster assembly scaffold protein n=1 Tax=Pseudahrensia aquimaris TaxID=744461 RepID=A0ABW3FCM6_9HYPH
MTIDAVYNSKLLEFAGNIPRIGRLDAPDGSAKAHSKLCGSTVSVDVMTDGERVTDYAHDVKACALGQAAASILAANVIGATMDELVQGREELRAMLKEDGGAPTGRFAELEFLSPVKEYRARHASTMLAYDAVVQAMEQALARHAA